MELQNVRSFYKEAQKSPFKFFPWKTGNMHFKFLPVRLVGTIECAPLRTLPPVLRRPCLLNGASTAPARAGSMQSKLLCTATCERLSGFDSPASCASGSDARFIAC